MATANQSWEKRAARQLKAELAKRGLKYPDLVKKLARIGVKVTYASVSNKVSRGAFTFVFFMQCMKAIGCDELTLID